VSVCLSLAAFPHYCTEPDVTWGNGRGCPLVGRICNRCMGFVAVTAVPNAKCQRVLVLAVCLVIVGVVVGGGRGDVSLCCVFVYR